MFSCEIIRTPPLYLNPLNVNHGIVLNFIIWVKKTQNKINRKNIYSLNHKKKNNTDINL